MWEMTDAGWRIVGFLDTQMSAVRVKAKQDAAKERYDRWQHKQATQRVSSRVANGAARPPAPPDKGEGQKGGEGVAAGLEEPAAAVMDEVPHPTIQAPTRRKLAAMIREAPNSSLRRAYVHAFRETFGSLYSERPHRTSLHPSMKSMVRVAA
jgi:hypothetical protein